MGAPAALFGILLVMLLNAHAALSDEPATRPATQASATTAPAPKPFPAMRQWFAELANPDGEIRNEAMVNLMGLRADDLPALRKLVEESRPLAPEQLVSLKQIVIHDFLATDPYDAKEGVGFLGIHLPNISEDADAIVVNRLPGFIGERMLRDGDVILRVLEHPAPEIRKGTDLTTILSRFSVGQTVHLEILRQGHVIRVPVRLDPYPLDASSDRDRMEDFLFRRLQRAQEYWDKDFADLVEEMVS